MSRGIRELAASWRWRTGAVDAVHQACLQVRCVRGKCKDAGEFDEGLRSELIVAVFLDVPHLKAKLQSVPPDDVSEGIGERIGVEDELAGDVNFTAHGGDTVVKDEISKIVRRKAMAR